MVTSMLMLLLMKGHQPHYLALPVSSSFYCLHMSQDFTTQVLHADLTGVLDILLMLQVILQHLLPFCMFCSNLLLR